MRKFKPINCTMPEDLLEKVDSYCEQNGLDRSKLIRLALADYLDMKEQLPKVKEVLSDYLDKTSALVRGELDFETWEDSVTAAQITINDLKQKGFTED